MTSIVTPYDYLDIAFYICFLIGIGLYFSNKNKNTTDYFQGGGIMPWWVTGASAWMASFSAWTFTGAAGKIFKDGPYVLCLYYSAIIPYLVLIAFTCYRFRRMRVVTPLEAVRLRFGPVAQQFYTWVRIPIFLIFGGFGINAVGVFMSAVFGLHVEGVLVGLGVIVTTVALLGGSFGIAANDFVQMFLVMTITIVTALLTLAHPQIGSLHGLLSKVPSAHFH